VSVTGEYDTIGLVRPHCLRNQLCTSLKQVTAASVWSLQMAPRGAVRSKTARTFSNFPIILAAGIQIPFLSSLLDIQWSLIIVLLIKTPTK